MRECFSSTSFAILGNGNAKGCSQRIKARRLTMSSSFRHCNKCLKQNANKGRGKRYSKKVPSRQE